MKTKSLLTVLALSSGFFWSSGCVVRPAGGQIPASSVANITPLDIDDLPIHVERPRYQTVDDPPIIVPGVPQTIVIGVDPTTGAPMTTTIPGAPTTIGGGSTTYIRYPVTNVDGEDVIKADAKFFDFDKNGNLVRTFPWQIVKKNHRLTAHASIFPVGGYPRSGHKWVVAVLNVETDTGVWSIDDKQATQSATDLIAGKNPAPLKPVYKKK